MSFPYLLGLFPTREPIADAPTTRVVVGGLALITELGPAGASLLLVDDLTRFTVAAQLLDAQEVKELGDVDAVIDAATVRIPDVLGALLSAGALQLLRRPVISGPMGAEYPEVGAVRLLLDASGASFTDAKAKALGRWCRWTARQGNFGTYRLVGFDSFDLPVVAQVGIDPDPLGDDDPVVAA